LFPGMGPLTTWVDDRESEPCVGWKLGR